MLGKVVRPRPRLLSAAPILLMGPAVATPGARASDASLKGALKVYEQRLTADIGYLAGFTVPSKHSAAVHDRKDAQREIGLAIGLFESGGKLLHLF